MKLQAITRSLKRLLGVDGEHKSPTAEEIRDGILVLLQTSSGNVGAFLDIARNQGSLDLDNLRNDEFHGGFIPNLYQLGANHDLGFVVLPGAKMLNRSFDSEAVVVHVSVGEDIFYISLLLDEKGDVQCRTGWKKDQTRSEWPQEMHALQNLKVKVVAVIALLADLLARQAEA